MNLKYALGAFALTAALAIGAPSFAQDNDNGGDAMAKKPMHHHAMHHHRAMHHEMHHEMHHAMHHHAMHHMHGKMGSDSAEQAETAKLNQEQLQHPGN